MKEKTITFQSLDISPTVYFLGTEEEQEKAEQLEEAARKALKAIITAPGFIALKYSHIHKNGRISEEILHHSPRRAGALYQLSYIYNSLPTMHENYIKGGEGIQAEAIHTEKELYRHLISKFNGQKAATFTILTA